MAVFCCRTRWEPEILCHFPPRSQQPVLLGLGVDGIPTANSIVPQLTGVREETKPFCFYFYSGLMLGIERIKTEPCRLVW